MGGGFWGLQRGTIDGYNDLEDQSLKRKALWRSLFWAGAGAVVVRLLQNVSKGGPGGTAVKPE